MLNLAYADLVDGHPAEVVAELDAILAQSTTERAMAALRERLEAVAATGGEVVSP